MMDALLAASPAFAGEWDAFRREWADEADDLALSDFARHVIALLEAKDVERLRRIFGAVESLHVEGDAYVRGAATIGLLEDLQNRNLHHKTAPEQFRCFLLPESLRWWDRVDSFWRGNLRALFEESDGGPAAG